MIKEDKLQFLNKKIEEFVKKFYLNKLIKGLLIFLFISILALITISVLEYFSFFHTTTRTILFYSYIVLVFLTLSFYIIFPLTQILGFGKQISKEYIARIVGKHFNEIDDKFLNIIQLEDQLSKGNYKSYQLLLAAIETKIDAIKPFSFVKAIPFHKTKRVLKWAFIPMILFILIFSINSKVFTESTHRIVNYRTYFEKPAPYSFYIENENLTVFQNDDFVLNIKVVGEELPKEVFVSFGNRSFRCKPLSNSTFTYTFSKITKDIDFQISTDEFFSKKYTLTVLPKPVIISFVMLLDYPSYLNKNSEIIDNNGDASVPEGTKITWTFYTKNTDTLKFFYHDQKKSLFTEKDKVKFSLTAREDFDYGIVNSNAHFSSTDTLKSRIMVIKDQYPQIEVESQRDSVYIDRIYFKGNIRDDYGFMDLKFVYQKYDPQGKEIDGLKKIDIQIHKNNTLQDFYYYFDAGVLELQVGEKAEYYFEVRDNDVINGYKAARSSSNVFNLKTLDEINEELNKSSSQTKEDMSTLLKETAVLMKEIEKIRQQIIQSQATTWQDKKRLENLIERFNELKQQMDQIKQQQKQQNQIENQFKNLSEDILKKQQDLQKRMEDILSDEMKDMLQKMQEMMEKMNKNDMQDAMDKMKLNAEDINKSLDIQLQLYKQLEYEKRVNDLVDKVRQLSQEGKTLAEEAKDRNQKKEDLIQKQEELQNKFEDVKKEIKELEKLNKELEDPNKQTNTNQLQKEIEQAMQESIESLQKNNRNKATEKQNESAEKMDELADQMEKDLLDSQEEDLAEDIETLRQILDNLVKLSFDQENTMLKIQKMNARSSMIPDVMKEQNAIKDYFKVIEDSLTALARRQIEVKPFVMKEVEKIKNYLASTQDHLIERRLPNAAKDNQFILTSMNNLALMLAESMKNMKESKKSKQECKNGKSGKQGKCSSSGKGKSAKSARELQQQLNRQMEALKKSMEQQGKQPEGKGNNRPGQSGQPFSEELAKMAAQQEAIRKMMQDIQNDLKSQNGVGDKSIDQMIKEMEQTEKDLVNRIISPQTIDRQKRIETRLLESEKAQMKQEQEEKREGIEAREIRSLNPPKEWNIDKRKESQNEMLKTVPVNLNYYYKEKINQYFFNIEQ